MTTHHGNTMLGRTYVAASVSPPLVCRDSLLFFVSRRLTSTCLSVPQGIDAGPGGLTLISDIIREKMGMDVSVLMGANIANEVAAEKFCETTIGESDTRVLLPLK